LSPTGLLISQYWYCYH